jgi:hypothetical protein
MIVTPTGATAVAVRGVGGTAVAKRRGLTSGMATRQLGQLLVRQPVRRSPQREQQDAGEYEGERGDELDSARRQPAR